MSDARGRIVYQNPWITVRETQVEGEAVGVVDTRTATAVVALTPDLQVYLVGQYRYTMEEYSWEVIEGGGDPNEPAVVAAQRELKEEAGLEAAQWDTLAGPLHLSNAYSSEVGYLYLATGLREVGADPEGTEDLQLIKIPFAEAVARVLTGEIVDGMSIMSLLLVERRLKAEGLMPGVNLGAAAARLPVFPNPWTLLSSEDKYQTPRIHLREDQVLRPDGNPGIYGVVKAGPRSKVLLRDAAGRVLLLRMYRPTTGADAWELPGRWGDAGDDPAALAVAVLAGLGVVATALSPVALDLQMTNCHATDRAYLYSATLTGPMEEVPSAEWFDLDTAVTLVTRGDVQDGMSVIALLLSARD